MVLRAGFTSCHEAVGTEKDVGRCYPRMFAQAVGYGVTANIGSHKKSAGVTAAAALPLTQ